VEEQKKFAESNKVQLVGGDATRPLPRDKMRIVFVAPADIFSRIFFNSSRRLCIQASPAFHFYTFA